MEDTTNQDAGLANGNPTAPVVNGAAHTPTGSTPVAPIPETAPPAHQARQIKDPAPEDIGASLSKGNAAEKPHVEGEATTSQPGQIDLSMLRPEQLQQLKAMLAVTPERALRQKTNSIVTIRRFTTVDVEGKETSKLITSFKNAYNTMVRDELANMNKEVVMIPVHFLGDADGVFVNINYKDFINSEAVRCEVLSTRNEPGRIVEGMVLSRETGQMIEREIKTLETWFTIKLPEGTTPSTIEIPATIANG